MLKNVLIILFVMFLIIMGFNTYKKGSDIFNKHNKDLKDMYNLMKY
jgi:hypothetical protein